MGRAGGRCWGVLPASRGHITLGGCRNETGKTAGLWRRRDTQNNRTKTTRQSATNSKNMKNQKNRHQTKSTTPQESQARPTEEQIAVRARAIYEARGSLPGHDLENWLQAEMELLHQCNRQVD
jgi:hypothetical protein